MAEKTERQKLIDALEEELHKVEAITQKISLTSWPLYINGKAFPKIWIPSWHNMEVVQDIYDYDQCDKVIEGSVGGGTRWTCTMPLHHVGFSHAAAFIERELESKDDQIIEIWGNRERSLELTGYSLWVYDSSYGEGIQIPKVRIPNLQQLYANHYLGSVCKEKEIFTGNGWICTMPTGHKHSHMAGSGDTTLAIWEKID